MVIDSNQTGGTGNKATVNQTVKNTDHESAIRELREKVTTLPPEKHEEAHSVIDQIEDMLEKGPRSLAAVRVMITGLVTYWPDAMPWLTALAQQMLGI